MTDVKYSNHDIRCAWCDNILYIIKDESTSNHHCIRCHQFTEISRHVEVYFTTRKIKYINEEE